MHALTGFQNLVRSVLVVVDLLLNVNALNVVTQDLANKIQQPFLFSSGRRYPSSLLVFNLQIHYLLVDFSEFFNRPNHVLMVDNLAMFNLFDMLELEVEVPVVDVGGAHLVGEHDVEETVALLVLLSHCFSILDVVIFYKFFVQHQVMHIIAFQDPA